MVSTVAVSSEGVLAKMLTNGQVIGFSKEEWAKRNPRKTPF
jgi:hypothetical protein